MPSPEGASGQSSRQTHAYVGDCTPATWTSSGTFQQCEGGGRPRRLLPRAGHVARVLVPLGSAPPRAGARQTEPC